MDSPDEGMKFSEEVGTEQKLVTYMPMKTGSFPSSCSKKIPFMKSHRGKGMKGKLEVIE